MCLIMGATQDLTGSSMYYIGYIHIKFLKSG